MKTAPKTAWRPGQSGNPSGRTPGTGEVARLRASIASHLPDIIDRLVVAAKAGDVGASRLLLERVCAPLKATETSVPIPLPQRATLTDAAHAVLRAAAEGKLAPTQAAALLTGVAAVGRVAELDEIERRLRAIEEADREPPP